MIVTLKRNGYNPDVIGYNLDHMMRYEQDYRSYWTDGKGSYYNSNPDYKSNSERDKFLTYKENVPQLSLYMDDGSIEILVGDEATWMVGILESVSSYRYVQGMLPG